VSTGRLEAFSDGVIAVAITLLVLDLAVPGVPRSGDQHAASLAHQLGDNWPHYAAYVVSFLTIGIIWINHHSMLSRLGRADHVVLVLNLFLLLSICVLPFVTSLMASYLNAGTGADRHVAAAVYSGAFLVMALAFSALNGTILLSRPQLLGEPQLSEADRRLIFKRAFSGVIPYVVALAVAPISAYATLAICGAIAIFYALPIASGR
jgi:uncharacterized membrane protein